MKLAETAERTSFRASVKLADDVRDALKDSVDIKRLAKEFVATFKGTTVTPKQARDWARIHGVTKTQALSDVFNRVYGSGWVLGDAYGRESVALASRGIKKAQPSSGGTSGATINWATWTPGDSVTAALLRPKGGLKKLLARQKPVTIRGINDTSLDRLGTVLADSIAEGATIEDTAASILEAQIVDDMETVLDDPERALTIANTEMNRAMSQSTMDVFGELGVSSHYWYEIDGCENICVLNADAGPIPVGDEFPSGDIATPGHPNCRCALVPFVEGYDPQVDGAAGYGAYDAMMADMEMSMSADVVKYAPDQLRDLQGRFTIDGGSADYTAKGWSRVDPADLVRADVAKYKIDSLAAGKQLTEKEVKAFERKSEKFYANNFVMRNGSVLVYAQKPDYKTDKAGTSISKEEFSQAMKELDAIQSHAPLENVSVFLGKSASAFKSVEATCLKTGEGSAIKLDLNTIELNALSARAFKTQDDMMPANRNVETSFGFTLAHEWGHAVDNASGDTKSTQVAEVIKASPSLSEGLSKYSGKSKDELYAELFAQHYFEATKGEPSIPATEKVKGLLK